MKKQEFKAESKRLMDLMINSIYTNKEIFLREVISNASDAIDKLYYQSLTDSSIKIEPKELMIKIDIDKEKRTLTISDNGIGMNKEDLETNLGTIAKSGSFTFKEENEKKKDIDIIGQFGVGFYSSFMVANQVEVISKTINDQQAYRWTSEGVDGYSIGKCEKDTYGTDVILTIKEDNDDENYSRFLEQYTIESLVKKYSDYITHPIQMEVETVDDKDNKTKELKIMNSLIPLWKRKKNEIKEEEYQTFYSDKFLDYEKPLTHIHVGAEGALSYDALLFIPSHTPYNYYSKDFEKGLQLYANGVLIMEKSSDLLPDYFSFVKGVVDSPDVSLNISREMLQQTKVLKTIANNLEKKIKKELENIRDNNRENYEEFFKSFGMQLKFNIYNSYGMQKENLQDLLLFYSSKTKKMTTLKEYVERMKKSQKGIYFACGETIDKINMLPQVEAVKDKKYEILYCTDYLDEFVLKMILKYEEKDFLNVSSDDLGLISKKEEESLKEYNDEDKDMFEEMKKAITDIKDIRYTNRLTNHPVCLTTEGNISIEMEKTINAMPTDETIKSEKILEINLSHEIVSKLKQLYKNNQEQLQKYTKILYNQARLIEGLPIENPTELSNLVCDMLSK